MTAEARCSCIRLSLRSGPGKARRMYFLSGYCTTRGLPGKNFWASSYVENGQNFSCPRSNIHPMHSGTFLRASQYRIFWRIRSAVLRIRFKVLSQIFRIRYIARDKRTNAGILLSFITSTASQFLVAVCVTATLEVAELLLVPLVATRWPIPESSNYVTWLSSLAQIGGVFIALYFTAVTAAAGAIYATVPNNIRELLTRERIGNIYIRYLTQATFIPLCLIAVQSCWITAVEIGASCPHHFRGNWNYCIRCAWPARVRFIRPNEVSRIAFW